MWVIHTYTHYNILCMNASVRTEPGVKLLMLTYCSCYKSSVEIINKIKIHLTCQCPEIPQKVLACLTNPGNLEGNPGMPVSTPS